jgi:hypothetical protein
VQCGNDVNLRQKVVTAVHFFKPLALLSIAARAFLSKGVEKHQGTFMQKKNISAANFFLLYLGGGGARFLLLRFF